MKKTIAKQTKTDLVGCTAKPTILDNTTKLSIDTNASLPQDVIEAGLTSKLRVDELDKFTSISNNRNQIYTLIDTMAKDSDVSAIIKTYADTACSPNDNGHIVWCESEDPNISKFINYLLGVAAIDKKIYGWTYNLVKYGDTYLRLFRDSDYTDKFFKKDHIDLANSEHSILTESMNENVNINLHSARDRYSYYIEMVSDPGTMFELTRYGTTVGYIETPNMQKTLAYSSIINGYEESTIDNYKMKSGDVNIWQADDFVHACLEDVSTRYPETVELFATDEDMKNNTQSSSYSVHRGKSMLIDNYKTWRQKSLLENAILLNRLTKSSILRKVGVEVGDMPKEQATQTLRRIKDMFEQKTALNKGDSMSEYANPGPVENFIYYVKHNGQGEITVDSVGGDVDVKNLADLDNWVNKYYSGFGIPKAYFGYTDDGAGFNGGTSLSIISSVFANGVKHVQSAMTQALTDAISLFLVNRGLKSYLNRFTLKMKAPSTQEEINYREDLTNKISAISNFNGLFTDIENKPRRLKILKSLVSTLNFGDNILSEIDNEISATEKADKKAAEEAEAAKQAELEAAEKAQASTDSLALGNSSQATFESLQKNKQADNLDNDSLNKQLDNLMLEDTTDLPTPEEAANNVDFSKNTD